MVTVMINYPNGGYLSAKKNLLTGYIDIETYSGITERDEFSVDPKEPDIVKWMKAIFQPIHLEILLDN